MITMQDLALMQMKTCFRADIARIFLRRKTKKLKRIKNPLFKADKIRNSIGPIVGGPNA